MASQENNDVDVERFFLWFAAAAMLIVAICLVVR